MNYEVYMIDGQYKFKCEDYLEWFDSYEDLESELEQLEIDYDNDLLERKIGFNGGLYKIRRIEQNNYLLEFKNYYKKCDVPLKHYLQSYEEAFQTAKKIINAM